MKGGLKLLGGILLIVGTSLGGGMLALPIATASSGFFDTCISLFIIWLAMTVCAFYILEVNLYLPKGANMISMAQKTLGSGGKAITWISYLFLLYALLSAYIAGGSDVFQDIFQNHLHFPISQFVTTCLYVLLFAIIVYTGIKTVDKLNSLLMYAKLLIYFTLLYLVFPYINPTHLTGGSWYGLKESAMLLITSFGYAIIVPSLREYFNDDVQALRKVIFVGSLFPLLCYLAWIAAIMGVIGANGDHGLLSLLTSQHQTSGLASALEHAAHQHSITNLFRFFSSISMLTAFLGVSLCLFDFLADGLNVSKKGLPGLLVATLVFVPPLTMVLFHPGIYIASLQYAGILCVILLLLLPALMALSGRKKGFATAFTTPGGTTPIFAVLILSVCLLIYGIFSVLV